ncbi:MAG TPA: glycoside hydrolase family 130 protein [Polyangiaceae bacterium]|nr:glycoside hydrolase family 130 protein [Polyangiaceae bacterium]
MQKSPVPVVRSELRLLPDPKRVISKPFLPGGNLFPDGRHRVERILARVLGLPEETVEATLSDVYERFASRHLDFTDLLERQFRYVARHVPDPQALSEQRRRLLGAYFTHEYSIDAAALTNPSLVQAPHQEGVAPGALRVIMSLRAIGEGHLSSIQFRSGVVDAQGRLQLDELSRFARTALHRHPTYDKATFRTKLSEMGVAAQPADEVLASLPERFSIDSLEGRIHEVEQVHSTDPDVLHVMRTIHWLASSNYESTFHGDSQVSERIIFPSGPTESHGMEDARFVRFRYDDGSVTYFAPYTAYDGLRILPQLIETRDFMTFRMTTLNGSAAVNKGIALFPRLIDGSFVALARLDNENNYLIRSNNVRFWHDRQLIQSPRAAWELVQLGNCGSPIETEAGWIVITHGVGPLRTYALGALLLDLKDPSQVIGCLEQPLLAPAADERDGYVPNVVYSCGSMRVGNLIFVPYGISDMGARVATVKIDDLLSALTQN